jgi:hypothetical protein
MTKGSEEDWLQSLETLESELNLIRHEARAGGAGN